MRCHARQVSAGALGRATGHTSGARRWGAVRTQSGTGHEHRGVVIPTSLVGNSRVERRRSGGTRRRDLRRDAEMPEDPLDHDRLVDERDQAKTPAASRTRQHVTPERACHERRPTLAAGVTPRRLGGVMRGAPVRAIQELAGHRELSTTLRYMHVSPVAIDSAIRLLELPTPAPAGGNSGATEIPVAQNC